MPPHSLILMIQPERIMPVFWQGMGCKPDGSFGRLPTTPCNNNTVIQKPPDNSKIIKPAAVVPSFWVPVNNTNKTFTSNTIASNCNIQDNFF